MLEDAKNRHLAVIGFNHAPFTKSNAERIESKRWNSWLNFITGAPSKKINFDSLSLAEEAVSIVENFITNGGIFICWLTGHTHTDNILTHKISKHQFMFNSTTARFDRHTDGVSAGSTKTPIYDSFNYIGVDLRSNMLKIWRIGWNQDSAMQIRTQLCYDYKNMILITE